MNGSVGPVDLCAQPFAAVGGGVLPARPLTRDDLLKIRSALTDFKKALAEWDCRREEERRKAAAKRAGEREDEDPGTAQAEGEEGIQPSPDKFHCLIVTGYLGDGYGPGLDKSTEEAVAEACAKHFEHLDSVHDGYPVEPQAGRIHVILHSRGGSLDSAYKIVLYLRNFAKEVRVYVPCRAKSAATLIAIGADQVVMSPFGELGPLDTQITDPRNPATRVSALDCYRSVDYVREFGNQTIPKALKVMLRETQALIPLAQLLDSATAFAMGSVKPMLEQVKGLDFGAWGRTLKIGETYAKEVRVRLRHPDSEDGAERIAEKLVYGYSHHLYPIDIAEAKSLGIAVDTMPGDAYKAAKAIARACRGEARFVGFSEELEDAIAKLAEPRDYARRPAPAVAAGVRTNGSPQAYGAWAMDLEEPANEDPDQQDTPSGPVGSD